jgi:hypothetical protein
MSAVVRRLVLLLLIALSVVGAVGLAAGPDPVPNLAPGRTRNSVEIRPSEEVRSNRVSASADAAGAGEHGAGPGAGHETPSPSVFGIAAFAAFLVLVGPLVVRDLLPIVRSTLASTQLARSRAPSRAPPVLV